MGISQVSNVQVAGSMSILKSANKQPELALEVLQGALQSDGAGVQGAQQAVQSVEAPDADTNGRRIDIRV